MSFLFYDPPDKKGTFAARAKGRSQNVSCEAKKRCSLGERVVSPVRVEEKSPLPSTPRDSRRQGKRANARRIWLDLERGLRTLLHMKKNSATLMKTSWARPVLYGLEMQNGGSRLGCAVGRRLQKNEPSAENPPNVKSMQARRQGLKHGRLADSAF